MGRRDVASQAGPDGRWHAHVGNGAAGLSAAAQNERSLWLVLGLTAVYLVVQVAGGVLANSLALLADAGHMLTDVLGLAMALAAIRVARRPATPAKTYGFYRAEVLVALANSVVLFGIALYIFSEAWHRFQEPQVVHGPIMLVVAVGGLLVNAVGMKLLHSGAAESLNVRGAFLEVLADFLGSLGAVLAGLVVTLTGWWPADALVSVAIGLYILPRTWRLLHSALDVLLEATPGHIRLEEVAAAMSAVPGVVSVHDLHVWTISSGFVAMSGHVEADGRSSSDVLHDLRERLRERFGIQHTTLQVEQCRHPDVGICCEVDPRCLTLDGTPVGAVGRVTTGRANGSDGAAR